MEEGGLPYNTLSHGVFTRDQGRIFRFWYRTIKGINTYKRVIFTGFSFDFCFTFISSNSTNTLFSLTMYTILIIVRVLAMNWMPSQNCRGTEDTESGTPVTSLEQVSSVCGTTLLRSKETWSDDKKLVGQNRYL